MQQHLQLAGMRRLERNGHLAKLDAAHQLCKDDQIQDDGGSQQAVFTSVVNCDCAAATHEDLADVLVHGTLGIAHVRHIPGIQKLPFSHESP